MNLDLFAFSAMREKSQQSDKTDGTASELPLPERLRPRSLDEMFGQAKVLGPNSSWRQLFKQGQWPSLILWGPPGCGKTTFALLLSQHIDAEFLNRNAIDTGAKILRDIGEEAHSLRVERRRRTLLFIDEIHRLNKSQQDILLPYVEKGDLVLIGATTENPSYELNNALLSRCRVLLFERLSSKDLEKILLQAAQKLWGKDFSLESWLSPECREYILDWADGDARRLLHGLELLSWSPVTSPKNQNPSHQNQDQDDGSTSASSSPHNLNISALQDVLGTSRPSLYDKNADFHYDIISAFIKSVRGSDPDAAVYYLARMEKGGEDPIFIARRLVILASEDIGNADPRALQVAVAGLQAVELVGWPEAAINLAQVTTYLACAPKSNRSYQALRLAQAEVEKSGSLEIPLSLRSARTKLTRDLGYGKGYAYSHDGPRGYIEQDFLPEALRGRQFYDPADRGFEKNIRDYLAWMRGQKRPPEDNPNKSES